MYKKKQVSERKKSVCNNCKQIYNIEFTYFIKQLAHFIITCHHIALRCKTEFEYDVVCAYMFVSVYV